MTKITPEHTEHLTFHTSVVIPEHGERDTKTFRKNVEQLKKDGFYSCAICGSKEKTQVHHFSEFCFEEITDFEKLKKILMIFDFYGYSAKMKDKPIETIDDIRNLICLCQPHHTGKDMGVHYVPLPFFITQYTCKNIPIPQKGETIEEVQNRI